MQSVAQNLSDEMLHFRDRRDAPLLRHREGNGAEITVLMCEYKPFPVWFSCGRKSYPVKYEQNLNC